MLHENHCDTGQHWMRICNSCNALILSPRHLYSSLFLLFIKLLSGAICFCAVTLLHIVAWPLISNLTTCLKFDIHTRCFPLKICHGRDLVKIAYCSTTTNIKFDHLPLIKSNSPSSILLNNWAVVDWLDYSCHEYLPKSTSGRVIQSTAMTLTKGIHMIGALCATICQGWPSTFYTQPKTTVSLLTVTVDHSYRVNPAESNSHRTSNSTELIQIDKTHIALFAA